MKISCSCPTAARRAGPRASSVQEYPFRGHYRTTSGNTAPEAGMVLRQRGGELGILDPKKRKVEFVRSVRLLRMA